MSLTRTVEMDFNGDGSYTDISAYALTAAIQLGNTDPAVLRADVGTCDLTLNNSDLRFTPDNASGPYYGYLNPGVAMRVSVSDGVTTWRLFTGYVEEWLIEPDQYGTLRANARCHDQLGRIQDIDLRLPLQENVTADELVKLITSNALQSGVAAATVYTRSVAPDDTITIGDVTYTFKSALTPTANEVALNSHGYSTGAEDSAVGLAEAIVRDTGSGTYYAAATERHPYVTANGYMAIGWSAANQDSAYDLQRSTTNYARLGVAFRLYSTEPSVLPVTRVYLYLKKTGAPTGTLTARIEAADSSDLPSDVAYHANATATLDEADLTTSYAWYAVDFTSFNLPRSAGTDSDWYWLTLTTDRAASGTDYVTWGADSSSTARFAAATHNGAAWSARAEAQGPIFYIPGRVVITATAHGAWGNALALESSEAARVIIPGATLSGGVDGPVGAIDCDTGVLTLDIAADTWTPGETNALTALEDVANSERGRIWNARDGSIVFKNQQYSFLLVNGTPSLTSSDAHTGQAPARRSRNDITNRITVSYRPRVLSSLGVIAQSQAVIAVPPTSDESGAYARNNATVKISADIGGRTVVLPYVDSNTGDIVGAKNLVLPLAAGTDFSIYDTADTSGFNYTSGGYVRFNVAVTASGVEIHMTNSALGTLYVHDLQVRGYPLLKIDPLQVVLEDESSQSAYGTRSGDIDLPFAATDAENFARALCEYELDRRASPRTIVDWIEFRGDETVGGVNPYALELGDMIAMSETQNAISNARYMIIGAEYQLPESDIETATLYLSRLDDTTYWLLGETGYSELGETTVLGL